VSFIRPTLEFGLFLIRPLPHQLQMLERFCYHALCRLFSLAHTTSRVGLLLFAQVPSFEFRLKYLQARLFSRWSSDSSPVLTSAVLRFYSSSPVPYPSSPYDSVRQNSLFVVHDNLPPVHPLHN